MRTLLQFPRAIGSIHLRIFSDINIASSIIIVSQEYQVAGARHRDVKNLHSEIVFLLLSIYLTVLSRQIIESFNRGILVISFWIYPDTNSKALTEYDK